MNRTKLGSKLIDWNNGQDDPVYMVGSYYFEDKVYPDKEIVEKALEKIERYLNDMELIQRGGSVLSWSGNVDLLEYYTPAMLQENVYGLKLIINDLKRYLAKDY